MDLRSRVSPSSRPVRPARAIGRVLVSATAGDAPTDPAELVRLVDAVDLDELIRRATYHGAVGSLFRALRDTRDVDPAVRSRLAFLYQAAVAVELKVLTDLSALATILDTSQVPWMVFKGPVLSERYYPEPGLRRFADLDILVPRDRFVDAVEALEAAGCLLMDRNWRLMAEEGRAQVHPSLPLGTEADLHWHVLNRDEVRSSFRVDVEALFSRARTVELNGVRVRTFGPVDTLLHLCVHAGLAGGDRLMWLKDIERVLAAGEVDWQEAVDRARAWGASVMIGVMLDRVVRTLGADVPDDVPAELAGRPIRALGRLVDRAWPPERSTGQRSPSWIWTRSLRGSGAQSIRVAGRKLRRFDGVRTAAAVWRGRGRPDRSVQPATTSAFHDPGVPQDRSDYLTVVEHRSP